MRKMVWLAFGLVASSSVLAAQMPDIVKVGEEALFVAETPHPVPLVEAGGEAWRDVFTWPKASYIAVHFSRFHLAPGERVIVSTPDGSKAYTFEGEGKPFTGGEFWATHVPGDTCVVTYYGNGGRPGWGYVVDKIAHGYPAPPTLPTQGPEGTEAICGADDSQWAKCYQTSEPTIYNQSRAIARLLIGGTTACTGWLVGCEGHVMTNNHCISTQATANNTDYEFMAEGATCATSCGTWGGCPGTIVASSGTLIKTDAPLDYTLIRLPTNASTTYGYFKLREGSAVTSERIYINGHPGAWGKRFAIASTHASDPTGFCQVFSLNEPACIAGGPPDVGYMCDTQGGSSGSPVVATSDGRVVALHHCANCPNRGVPILPVINHLRATNQLPLCAVQQLAGTVELSASSYPCSAAVGIVVRDDSLVGNPTQNVTIRSTTEPTPETVTLTAEAPGSGVFRGSIPISTAPPSSGDGQLSVAHGDVLDVLYIDADDGQGGSNIPRNASASVDCVAPSISGVGVSSITGNSAVINWTTNEPATNIVTYGSSIPPTLVASNPALVTSHAQPISGLAECTRHYFSVGSRDAAGNEATDNNAGSYYTFETLKNTSPSYSYTGPPVSIPDNNPTGASASVFVTDDSTVQDVDVLVNITHTYDGDLILSLVAPTGTAVTLSNRRGGSGDNFRNTVFDDNAATPIASGTAPFTGVFRPDTPLNVLNGINAMGEWKLRVVDAAAIDVGTIDNWTLMLRYPPGACGPALAYDSNTRTDTCGGAAGNGTVEPGEDVMMPVFLRNNGTTMVTGITGTVSTTTPGVTVTRPTAGFPDVATGNTVSSQVPHFAFTVGPAVTCGTDIAFNVSSSADQGSWSDSFTVRVGAQGVANNTYNSTDTPRPIPDVSTITSPITVPGGTGTVTKVRVTVNITHTYDGDLVITLVGPNGVRVPLANRRGGSGDNFTGTVFDDDATTPISSGTAPFAGTFRPESPLSALNGIAAVGVWGLEIRDAAVADTGTLQSWSLALTTDAGPVCTPCTLAAPSMAPQGMVWEDTQSLVWEVIPGATFYNLYRGVPADLPALLTADPDSCRRLVTTSPATGGSLTEAPSPDEFYWYLTRAANSGGEGPPGSSSLGPRSQQSTGACP